MKKFIILILILLSSKLFAESLTLKSGWNIIGIDQNISLETIKSELGANNVEVIQGAKKTYQKKYLDANLDRLNDFTGFEKGKGYWVYLSNGATINYIPTVYSGEEITKLKAGWNIINPLLDLTLEEIITQVGRDNLLIIQGATRTYQKSYVDEGNPDLNDFVKFEKGKGYWIKLLNNSQIRYSFKSMVDKEALDNTGNISGYTMSIQDNDYRIVVYSSKIPENNISNSTIGIYGLINGIDTANHIKLNDSYSSDTTFQVKVFDANSQLVGSSSVVEYNSTSINFSSITITIENNTGDDTVDNNNSLATLKTVAPPLSNSDYRLLQITDADFNALSFENQIIVADKLLSTLYFGMPHLELKTLIESGTFISTIKENLDKRLNDVDKTEQYIINTDYFHLPIHNQTNEVPLINSNAIVQHRFFAYEYLDKNFFEHWMSYVLTQTIMYSPASELNSARLDSVMPVYNAIYENIKQDNSIRYLTYNHMISLYNWRRFRSSEDNGREMLEIFLFDNEDAHVPFVAKALQNWKLNDKRELVIGINKNIEPFDMFGKTIYDGYDFYKALVLSGGFIEGVTRRIVNIYFNTFDQSKKNSIVSTILSTHPENFKDIFLQIIFSKEHLYNTDRVKNIDELFYSLAKKIHFSQDTHTFETLNRARTGMHQSAMSYKLGIAPAVPVDTSSFGFYRLYIYKTMLVHEKIDPTDYGWGKNGWVGEKLLIDEMYLGATDFSTKANNFLDYLFLSVVSRKPTRSERIYFYTRMEETDNWFEVGDGGAVMMIFDYLSRTTELFQYQKVK